MNAWLLAAARPLPGLDLNLGNGHSIPWAIVITLTLITLLPAILPTGWPDGASTAGPSDRSGRLRCGVGAEPDRQVSPA